MELREEFIERMEKIQKEPTVKVENIWKFFIGERK